MKHNAIFSLRNLTALCAAAFFVYYFLLHHNALHVSIYCIITYSHSLTTGKHLIILGLLPVYIAFMIFGAATLGIYSSQRIELLLCRIKRSQ